MLEKLNYKFRIRFEIFHEKFINQNKRKYGTNYKTNPDKNNTHINKCIIHFLNLNIKC